jgi:hypothetical protein
MAAGEHLLGCPHLSPVSERDLVPNSARKLQEAISWGFSTLILTAPGAVQMIRIASDRMGESVVGP